MRNITLEPHLFVVVGATGDLMRRKLLPALYRLSTEFAPTGRAVILGTATDDLTDESFRALCCQALGEAGFPDTAGWCRKNIWYQPMRGGAMEDYGALAARIADIERANNLPGNRAYYLALPPTVFPYAIRRLGEAGLNRSAGWTRIVVEKPFGHDLESARKLNRLVDSYFDESQVYRIDHYLGKETVQNLLVFRFANALFETVWNRDRVQQVDILVAESLGVEHRAAYYEKAGAIRDMIQNHLTQLLTITAMEVPALFNAESIRYEKLKVLRCIEPIRPEDVALGQYTRGTVEGKPEPGYREEPGVGPDSEIETFSALRVHIANWRWQGVPFVMRTGKRLARRLSKITVSFRSPPVSIFRPLVERGIHPNVLEITLQPDEGFALGFEMKAPGQVVDFRTQQLYFRYADAFAPLPPAYETLLLDVVLGDQTLFVSSEWVEASWALYTPLLERRPPLHFYQAGTWGPEEANRLLAEGAGVRRPVEEARAGGLAAD